MHLGVIADDLTGATDVALMLTAAGMRTLQVMDIPSADMDLAGFDAVVVALKSRTNAAAEAIAWSCAALEALQAQGARQILFKYCSTFDSTPQGNIGPVADALMDRLGTDLAIVCPAFPKNNRTIYQGHLFVGGVPLNESPMKDHPLTPMRDSSLLRLMQSQTQRKVGAVPYHCIAQGPDAIRAAFDELRAAGVRYAVTDALVDQHLIDTGLAARDMPLITGGSGIAMGLPLALRRSGHLSAQAPQAARFSAPLGRQAVLAGSCSQATRGQIAHAIAAGAPTRAVDAHAVLSGTVTPTAAADWILAQSTPLAPVLYSSADPAVVAKVQQQYGRDAAGQAIEHFMAETARHLVARGVTQLVVAGGETSGAVVQGLSIHALEIGPEIAPGVPWTRVMGGTPLVLALKSGNFGAPDFFTSAFAMLADG